jgi:hypothetical protein
LQSKINGFGGTDNYKIDQFQISFGPNTAKLTRSSSIILPLSMEFRGCMQLGLAAPRKHKQL